MNTNEPSQELCTAYHEAGHAVIAFVFERPVQKVSILPDQRRLGHCELRSGVNRASQDRLEADILIMLAGVAAEAIHSGSYNWPGAAQDLQSVRRLAEMRSGKGQADKLTRRLLAKAEHLLLQTRNWNAVDQIAVELVKKKTISGRAVRHYFEQSGK
jgi:ATP-dependent Zn protease